VIWGHEHVEISAIQAMQAENNGAAAHNPRREAIDFILQILADNGPTTADDLDKTAKAEGISNATLRRGRGQLKKEGKIKRDKDGLTGPWIWKLTDGEKDNVEEF
jgi:hypothetical protein